MPNARTEEVDSTEEEKASEIQLAAGCWIRDSVKDDALPLTFRTPPCTRGSPESPTRWPAGPSSPRGGSPRPRESRALGGPARGQAAAGVAHRATGPVWPAKAVLSGGRVCGAASPHGKPTACATSPPRRDTLVTAGSLRARPTAGATQGLPLAAVTPIPSDFENLWCWVGKTSKHRNQTPAGRSSAQRETRLQGSAPPRALEERAAGPEPALGSAPHRTSSAAPGRRTPAAGQRAQGVSERNYSSRRAVHEKWGSFGLKETPQRSWDLNADPTAP
ncbi:uncharacterized protein WM277_011669 [Molossus nigricans]